METTKKGKTKTQKTRSDAKNVTSQNTNTRSKMIWLTSKENIKKVNLKLKEKILSNEHKKNYSSDRFLMIEKKVKDALKNQNTDEALKDVTIWALVVWWSDVHYDLYELEVIVRFRIDWVLVDIFKLTHKEYKFILERLKYSASLKLNIMDIPQDWKYSLNIEEKKIDVRVSTLPTKYWENIVCRLLDWSKAIVDFEMLWFFWTSKRMVEKAITKKNWMVLVTGPTGSWKTTTLYTILSKLNTREKKIITLEDPIEYEMQWIIQSEVDDNKDYTFKSWLKAILRQDPDIVMIWEIRDINTLEIATSASLTWHLVLSTLHTKSAAETLDRIINMWLKKYILASALDTIIAQRLVRKICNDCKVEKEKTLWELAIIKNMLSDTGMNSLSPENIKLYEWAWCEKCNHSWYKWRIWIFEIISLNENIRQIIREWWSTTEIIDEARNWDLITMKEDWVLKAIKWFTTIEEILRVI